MAAAGLLMLLPGLRSMPGPAAASSAPGRMELSPQEAAALAVRVDGRGGGYFDTGGGVAVTSRLVVTNRHLVDGRVLFATACSTVDLGVRRVRRSATVDLAVLEVTGPDMRPVEVAAEDPEPATPVLMPGFPGGGPVVSVEGRVEDYLHTADGSAVLRFSPTPAIGQSGSPLLDAEGRLVGLAYAVDQVSGLGHAIPASELRRELTGMAAEEVGAIRAAVVRALPGAGSVLTAGTKQDKAMLRLVGVLNGTASAAGDPRAAAATAC